MTFNELGERFADKLADNAALKHENQQLKAQRDRLREALEDISKIEGAHVPSRPGGTADRMMMIARSALEATGCDDE